VVLQPPKHWGASTILGPTAALGHRGGLLQVSRQQQVRVCVRAGIAVQGTLQACFAREFVTIVFLLGPLSNSELQQVSLSSLCRADPQSISNWILQLLLCLWYHANTSCRPAHADT
jgi:hypothetical protein